MIIHHFKNLKIKNMLIAVYGSLRKGLGNHGVINNDPGTKYIGQFDTKPIFTLKNLGWFPGLLEGGNTSVVMEVYRVNEEVNNRVEQLEGWSGKNKVTNLYNKLEIKTPFGPAITYVYADPKRIEQEMSVLSGDWTDFVTEKKLKYEASK